MNRKLFLLVLFIIPLPFFAQTDSDKSKWQFNADFRFRVEQDWNSRKSDGTFRDDRTRYRYRLRGGVNYEDKWYTVGFRLRTGNQLKQQDPQITLGKGFKEFGTLPIGFEKVFFQGKWNTYKFWLGKNTFPFKKSNELFWSDNVYPEGVFLEKGFQVNSEYIDAMYAKVGHFIMSSAGKSMSEDAYFQGYQFYMKCFQNRFEIFPSLYMFKNIPNIPDGSETFVFDYSILHIGTRINLLKKKLLNVEFDYYYNFEDYSQNNSIADNFKEQKTGTTVGLKYGAIKQKGDWMFKASYAYLQQYAAVDFMAQNDWARWDYSSFGSPDGRLTNFNGIELVAGLMVDKKISLKMKYYLVEQLVPLGTTKENGSRIRLDLDVKF